MKRRRIPVILAAVVVAGLIYYFRFYLPGIADSEIRASGHIEVTEVDMSFRIPGHVAKLFVDEGMKPKKGELLAELEQEVIKARRDQAQAQLQELESREASLALTINIKEEVLDAVPKYADRDNRLVMSLPLVVNPTHAGNDEVSFLFD